MKIQTIGLYICLVLIAPFSYAQDHFQEGVNYQVVAQPATKQPQIMEFFSYGCPHCFALEPIILSLRKQVPANVQFKRTHVAFVGGDSGPLLQRAYAISDVLGVEKKFTPIFFFHIMRLHHFIDSTQALRQIFIDNGVSASDFDGSVNSFFVNNMIAQMDARTQDYHIRGVPTVVINGRYQIVPSSIKSVQQYIDLVNFLLKK